MSLERPLFGASVVLASLVSAIVACSSTRASMPEASRPTERPPRPSAPDPLDHGTSFVNGHAELAGSDSQACAACHSENECVACHDGRVRPRSVHPNDFLSLHAEAARMNGPSCSTCHHSQSFCVGCHERSGIAESGPVGIAAGRGRFHPPSAVWSSVTRGPGHHAWEAERNLSVCVSCHVERDCVRCHATRGVGGPGTGLPAGAGRANPHPSGFAEGCAPALRDNSRPCRVCHDAADPLLEACR
jgi:hypothetical protein